MKNLYNHSAVLLLATLLIWLQPVPTRGATASTPASSAPHPSLRPDIAAKLHPDPVGFIPNLGQLSNDSVRFTVRDHGVTAHFTDTGFVLQNGETTPIASDGISWTAPIAPRREVVGAQPVRPMGGRTYDHTVSYFRGNDHAKWRANVPAYGDLSYPETLPGTELRFESREHGFEYSFHVSPNVKPNRRFKYQGVTGLDKSPLGDLIVRTAKGSFTESRPVAFQYIHGNKREVECSFEIIATNEYRIEVGAYDHSRELIVDPVLDWSTFWGGSQADNSKTLMVAPDGNIVVADNSFSADLPEAAGGFGTGPGVNSNGGTWYRDAYVAKNGPVEPRPASSPTRTANAPSPVR